MLGLGRVAPPGRAEGPSNSRPPCFSEGHKGEEGPAEQQENRTGSGDTEGKAHSRRTACFETLLFLSNQHRPQSSKTDLETPQWFTSIIAQTPEVRPLESRHPFPPADVAAGRERHGPVHPLFYLTL